MLLLDFFGLLVSPGGPGSYDYLPLLNSIVDELLWKVFAASYKSYL